MNKKSTNRKKLEEHIRYMIMAAVFAAMVYVMTAFVHIPTNQGYVHVGDGMIYIAASFLPVPYAMAAAAIGAGLSDYLSGFPLWVLPTIVIKSLTVLFFTSKKNKIVTKRNMAALFPAGFICVAGYFAAGALLAFLSGTPLNAALTSALADIPSNILQAVGSSAFFIFCGAALDKTKVLSPQKFR